MERLGVLFVFIFAPLLAAETLVIGPKDAVPDTDAGAALFVNRLPDDREEPALGHVREDRFAFGHEGHPAQRAGLDCAQRTMASDSNVNINHPACE